MAAQPDFQEIGSTGLQRTSGFVIDDFITNLRGVQGMRVWREMSDNDPVVGAMLYAIERLILAIEWNVEPYIFSKFGNPIFQNSLCFIECKKHKVIKMGDHHIIIGEVIDFAKISDQQPLLYFNGKYRNLENNNS